MTKWMRLFTALLALALVIHMQVFFYLIWRDGELKLIEPNRALLAGEQVLYAALAVYCAYRVAVATRNIIDNGR